MDNNSVTSFKEYITEDMSISEEELQQMADSLTWEDIVDLYDDEELIQEKTKSKDEEDEEDEDESEEDEEEDEDEEDEDELKEARAPGTPFVKKYHHPRTKEHLGWHALNKWGKKKLFGMNFRDEAEKYAGAKYSGESQASTNEESEYLDETISAQSRIRMSQRFSRQKPKRNVAKGIKLRRSSSISVLKKRAVIAARNQLYKRFLRGRTKKQLSAAEKDRIEQQVKRLKMIQVSLAARLLPQMRKIEQKRLAKSRTK